MIGDGIMAVFVAAVTRFSSQQHLVAAHSLRKGKM
jgi:hypothetical protein